MRFSPAGPSADHRRHVFIVNATVALVAALLLAAVTLAAPNAGAQTSPTATPDYSQLQVDLDQAWNTWQSATPDDGSYEMDYRIVCRCSRRGTVSATVEAGVGSWTASDGRPTETWQELTVEAMFGLIQDGILNRYAGLQVTYNEFGVPTEIITDPIAAAVDEERTIVVDRFAFTVAPVDTRAEYEAARALWNESFGPATNATYAMSYQQFCFCFEEFVQEQTTWVRGATILNWKAVNGTTGNGPEYSMEDIFDRIEAELDGADHITVTYDDDYGYPTSFVLHGHPWIADDGYRINVNRFSPNDSFAVALHEAAVIRDNIEAPGDATALTYTRECSIRLWCPEGEASADDIQVDVVRDAASTEPGGMIVTGSRPADSTQPERTYYGAANDFFLALDWAADLIANGGDFIEVDVNYQANGELLFWTSYEVTIIPEESEPQTLTYTLTSIDPIAPPTAGIVYAESFEGAPVAGGWTSGPDSAVTGAFSIGDPEQTRRGRTIVQPENASDGVNALVTDARAGSFSGANDIDGGFVYTRSPIISLPATPNVTLSMDWYFGHAGAFEGSDSFSIVVNPTDSRQVSATVVDVVADGHRNGEWATVTADLSRFAGFDIQIVVSASDIDRRSVSEAGIDNVVITSSQQGGAFWSENFDGIPPQLAPSGDATSGIWNIGAPEPTSYRDVPLQLGTATSGSQALITDYRAGGRAGLRDVDGGTTSVVVGSVALPVTIAPVEFILSFDWYLAHMANTTAADHLTVTVFTENGRMIALDVRGEGVRRPGEWARTRVDISRFQGQTVSIAVSAADREGASLVEAGIDSMTIEMNNLPLPQ